MEDSEVSELVVIRGVKKDEHSPFQNRHSFPVPHSASQHAELLSNRPISVVNPLSVNLENYPMCIDLSCTEDVVRVIKVGWLSKTTQKHRDGGSRSEMMQKRHFRLTEEAFEYFQQFSWNEKVKRSFPLTSVEKVEYDQVNNPTLFVLAFSNCTEILHADTAEEASDWVEKITEACAEWHSMEEEVESKVDEVPTEDPSHFARDRSIKRAFIKQPESVTTKRNPNILKDYHMIKYPQHLFGLPNEKLFKMDTNNMQIMWKSSQRSRFHQSRSLSLHKVVEVREGQQTEKFDKFPYEQVKEQSFSLIYLKEDKRYVYLTSLNLICDHPQNYQLWINELKSKVEAQNGNRLMSGQETDTTDTTVLWLKQMWSCESIVKNELSQKEAISLARRINPFISKKNAKKIVALSHFHQIESSYGESLTLDGFILMFNLLTNITDSRLCSIYTEYARESPQLGIALDEFREFLVHECCWQRESCQESTLQRLMQFHDSYHHAYKKYIARNKSAHYVASQKLLSLPGFLSFLRSRDNSAIDPKHETVYQDMTQPLSHYFINSSHNTYLEGDQLSGKSSTEAYIRALLQGCRCVEIDCWDDTFNITNLEKREPIIYHGYTLTTKLPFREVIHTIKDYCFTSSNYPMIISIENHCNKSHQTRMAKIFRAIFDDMLPKEDLVKLEGREKLPSPQELQGKIILKGSCKVKSGISKGTSRMHWMINLPTAATCSIDNSPPIFPTCLQPTEEQTFTELCLTNESDEHVSSSLLIENTDSASPAAEESDSPSAVESTNIHFRFSRRYSSIRQKLAEAEKGVDDQELVFKETVGDLKTLIIYAKATSIKPWDWGKQKATTVTQMFSFGEPKAVELCTKDKRDMLACTERQLVRTYPKATRVDSSNYNPLPMWRCGIQMVALNYQYPDIPMHLNQGFFRLNGGCGYVLKPAVMRREDPGGGSTPFDPEMNAPHPDVPPIDLEIELISGQRLCPWKKKCSFVSVVIHTYGITHDCASTKEATHDKVLWPYWEKGKHNLKKTIFMPELCLVYFCVEADKKLFGQNCIPVISLQPGIKFIPLRTPGGELILESGLFVKIKKTTVPGSDSTAGLQHMYIQPSSSAAANDNRQLTCDAEVYETQFTNIDD